MKLNYLSHLKTGALSNLRVLRTQMHYVVLNYEAWLLTRLLPFVIGNGYGLKSCEQHLLTTRPLCYLFPHRKDITIFSTYTTWDKIITVQMELLVNTNPFDIQVTITHTFPK